jgi:ubiquinone/menaquinone biosynthesis C-methylase UbiE
MGALADREVPEAVGWRKRGSSRLNDLARNHISNERKSTMARPPQWTTENAGRFGDHTVVAAYHLRLPYPTEILDELVKLVADPNLPLLDIGTGTGEIARALAPRVTRVDAVDMSATMLARGRQLPGGDVPNLRWIEARAEDFSSDARYALITAGDSLHWMDWDVVLPKFGRLLVPGGYLAIVHRSDLAPAWQDDLGALIAKYSTSRFYETFDLIAELERRGLFEVVGRYTSPPRASRQPVDDYVESFHSRSSFSRENMPPGDVEAFGAALRALVAPWSTDGFVDLETVGEIVWGYPLAG